jgi:DNA repair exonuclease SbcCD ATPase subunit
VSAELKAWQLEKVEISGGFLAGLSLDLPPGLICIIGPRGSGKSTLAEAIRLVLQGAPVGLPKARLDLIKANLSQAVVTLTTRAENERDAFVIRRTFGQTALVSARDRRSLTGVDVDRGTFLPLDAYASQDIEALADESLGPKRRALLDDLRASEIAEIGLAVAEHQRNLEANADRIRAAERTVLELSERLEELGDVAARMAEVPLPAEGSASPEFRVASRQKAINERETSLLLQTISRVSELQRILSSQLAITLPLSAFPEASANEAIVSKVAPALASLRDALNSLLSTVDSTFAQALRELHSVRELLESAHSAQHASYLALNEANLEAVRVFELRAAVERQVATAAEMVTQRNAAIEELRKLNDERTSAKAGYLLMRDRVSSVREKVATDLGLVTSPRVRVRVIRNADVLEYRQQILDALRGSKLRNQDDILKSVSSIRPEDLASIVRDDDLQELEAQAGLGRERSRKVLDSLRAGIDALALEVLPIDDAVTIELNVASAGAESFRDASSLSRGQKCTALLPLLLARRSNPLIIDQPEDNLDNHFIYETVVESILRLKAKRQMIFVTHNANIPVLGEAELVVVLNSDGQRAFVEKLGTVDDCKKEIVDLLEGGEEAFQRRRRRYESPSAQ